jgi:hypothetical protein
MYSLFLLLHSWARWAVIVLALLAVVGGIRGLRSGQAWTPANRRANLLATVALDVQLLLGLALYFVFSPFTTEALGNFGAAMRTPALRFWAVEHLTMMTAALVLAHVGNVAARKAATDQARHLRSVLFFGIVLLLLFLGTPWPGLANGRPLFRFGF